MNRTSTWFLRCAVFVMGLIGLAIAIFGLPAMIKEAPIEDYPGTAHLLYVFVGGLYGAAIPFFIALYQSLKLLNYIDKNTAFSASSVNALKRIKLSAVAVSILFATGIPFLFQVAQLDDAPGLGLIALAFACSPLVIATFAAVLQKVLQNAIDIKTENDLTV